MLIEILITVAMVLYFVAYICARKVKPWWVHVIIASFAFMLDMWATYLMIFSDWGNIGVVAGIHIGLTALAISLFFVQAWYGAVYFLIDDNNMKKNHINFARKVFLPVWAISYLSGFLFLFK